MADQTGTIVIRRNKRVQGLAYPATILVDDRAEARLWNGQTVELSVSAGRHTLKAVLKPIGGRSKDLSLDVVANNSVSLVLKVSLGGWGLQFERDAPAERPTVVKTGAKLPRGSAASTLDDLPSATVHETRRSEVSIGSDVRQIDNSRGVSPIIRTFKVSREWTHSYVYDVDKSSSVNVGGGLGINIASIRLQVDTALKTHYSASEVERRTVEEEVTVTVAPQTRSRITFSWKEIHQIGDVVLANGDRTTKIPFEAVVGLTFDQEQTDEQG